jgi:cytoskeletal protein CcmA (bactofilin family)
MMLVLTMFALSMAAIVTNTASTLGTGRSASQARAAADAGVAAALGAFKKAKACSGTVSSGTPPVYATTCTADATKVTFVSIGRADDGHQATVQAVYGYTIAQAYGATVGQLTFFTDTGTFPPNVVTSSTPAPAKVVIASGNFQCKSAMASNVVVGGDFYAYSGCVISGWVKVKRTATMYGGSAVGQDLTSGGSTVLSSVSSVGGSLASGGNATVYGGSSIGQDLTADGQVFLDSGASVGRNLTCSGYVTLNSNSTVGGDLSTGGYATLASGTSVGGNLTSTGYSNLEGTVKGNLVAGGYAITGDNSSVEGSVTAAGSDRTWIHGRVGKDVTAVGPVTTHYNSVVTGDVTAAGNSTTTIYGTVRGDLTAGGAVLIDYNGSVSGDTTSSGTGTTSVYGALAGNLKVSGAVYLDYNGTVSGTVTAAGTGATSVFGRILASLKVAGTVTVDYNGSVAGDMASSGTATDNIYGRISGNASVGGNVYLPAGSIGGNLTQPPAKSLTPNDAKSRVVGTVTSKAAPAAPTAPSAPTVSLIPPVVTVSAPPSATSPQWQDYGYSSADWPGYTTQVLGSSSPWCSARNWATYLGTFTAPTIVDATACSGGLNAHPTAATAVTISARVVVVSSEIDLQYATFKAASGSSPNLWFIVPSQGGGAKSYAGTLPGSGEIDLDSSNLGVPTILYTPVRIVYHSSTFTGSMYSKAIVFDGSSPGDIKAAPVEFPLALFDSTAPPTTPSGTFSVTRISQREIA